jgi:K+-sensing histidine kinase KdpD
MTRLVDDLMDVARIAQGRIDLERVSVELGGVIAQAVETVGADIAAKSSKECRSLLVSVPTSKRSSRATRPVCRQHPFELCEVF